MNTLTLPDTKHPFGISASGYQWQFQEVDERLILAMSQKLELPEIVARVLAGRKLAFDDVPLFLNPTLKTYLPDPFHLKDMNIAANRLAKAVIEGENIAVFGDYDVDGATSSALLKRFFAMLGLHARVYIPDRIAEGYGPNTPALLKLRKEGAAIVITVDCGTAAIAPIKAAKEAGLETIVIDHHLGDGELPEALAIVNPNRLDETSPHRNMAAVGVAFLLIVAVNAVLRDKGWYKDKTPPDLLSLLDLVALGTVCDVMTLTGVNRAYVAQGLKIMAKRGNAGLSALADVAGVKEMPGVYHLGFLLGPRVNAGGRVGEAELGTRLLAGDDYHEAAAIAEQLDRYNTERKAIETLVLEQAIAQVESERLYEQPVIMAASEGWHPGVIGIVAGRLKEKYNRPTAVIAVENGIGKASARSITGVDLGSVVTSARAEGLLVAGGGHAMAAGFTVEMVKFTALKAFMEKRLEAGVAQHGAYKTLKLDAVLTVASATSLLLSKLEMVGPFGMGNPEPRFVLSNVQILRSDILSGEHIRCIVKDYQGKATLTAMAFRSLETPLGQALLSTSGKPCHIAGRLRLNRWQGNETVQLLVDDLAI